MIKVSTKSRHPSTTTCPETNAEHPQVKRTSQFPKEISMLSSGTTLLKTLYWDSSGKRSTPCQIG